MSPDEAVKTVEAVESIGLHGVSYLFNFLLATLLGWMYKQKENACVKHDADRAQYNKQLLELIEKYAGDSMRHTLLIEALTNRISRD